MNGWAAPEKRLKHLVETVRVRFRSFRLWADDMFRLGFLLLVLAPAGAVLPRSWAYRVAEIAGWLDLCLTSYGRDLVRAFWRSFPSTVESHDELCAAWRSGPLKDFVFCVRILLGREDLSVRTVVEVNAGPVRDLVASGRPFIVATGHFSREASAFVLLRKTLPCRVTAVIKSLDDLWWNPGDVRLRILFLTLLNSLKKVAPDVEFWIASKCNRAERLASNLMTPGSVVWCSLDAAWHRDRSHYVRPFAGLASRTLATGTARLARAAQCPLVLCVPYLDGDRVVLEWGDLIAPPSPKDGDADVKITDLLIDEIERAIGRGPSQYVLDVFGQRRWDSIGQRWESS